MILRNAGPADRAAAAAVAGVLDHDVDGEPRVVGGREPGERDREGAVVAAAVLADPLRGAGLAGHPVARDRGARGDAVVASVTSSIICVVCRAASRADHPVLGGGVGADDLAVVGGRWPLIRLGSTWTPPLAIVLTAAAICTALTARPWPNAMVSWLIWAHCDGSASRPAVSPRTPMSVRWPSPNLRR